MTLHYYPLQYSTFVLHLLTIRGTGVLQPGSLSVRHTKMSNPLNKTSFSIETSMFNVRLKERQM
jgi:hypothetical protein